MNPVSGDASFGSSQETEASRSAAGGGSRLASALRARIPLTSPAGVAVLTIVLGSLMVLGSFQDYQISLALLNELSTFAHAGAAFGWFPAVWALACAGTLIILAATTGSRSGSEPDRSAPAPEAVSAIFVPADSSDLRGQSASSLAMETGGGAGVGDENRLMGWLIGSGEPTANSAAAASCAQSVTGGSRRRNAEVILGGLLIGGPLAASIVVAPKYWNEVPRSQELPVWAYSVIGFAAVGMVVGLTWWLARAAGRRHLLYAAVFLISVVAAQAALIYIVKLIWLRPRMRLVVDDIGVHFRSWWHVGFPDVRYYLGQGIPRDDFKSFPSAHTGNAAIAMSFGVLVHVNTRLRPFLAAIFWIGFAWAVAVALSRIVMGAHFVTDTVVGCGISVGVTLVFYWVLFLRYQAREVPLT